VFTQENRKFLYIAGGVFLVFILVIVFLLVKGGGTKKTTTETNSLTIWALDDSTKNLDKVISKFQDKNNIKINYIKKDPSTYLNDSLAEIAAGKGPDIWEIPSTWLPKYHDQLVPMQMNYLPIKRIKNQILRFIKTLFRKLFPKTI
jgi:ABC-type glycerol-3-phosphate transport system substrate-binding protein